MPHKLISDISQIKKLPLQVKINRIQISPALEVIRWPGNGSLTIELDQVYPGENIEIDFGKRKSQLGEVLRYLQMEKTGVK